MGMGKKANQMTTTTTSASDAASSSSSASETPNGVSELSNGALEVAGAFSDLSASAPASWERSEVRGNSSFDSSDHPASKADDTATNGEPSAPPTPRPMETEENEAETPSEAADDDVPATDEVEPVPDEEPMPEDDESMPEHEQPDEAARQDDEAPICEDEQLGDVEQPVPGTKKRRSKNPPLHGKTKEASATAEPTPTGKSPGTALKGGRRKKQIAVGSSGESAETGVDAMADDDDEEEAAPLKQRKKKLSLGKSEGREKEAKKKSKRTAREESEEEEEEEAPKKKSKKKARKESEEEEAPAKAEKPKKDPNAPKRPLAAFMFFSAEERKNNPDVQAASFTEQGKMIGTAWKNLAEEDKAPFNQQAAEDKKRFARELKAYEATGGVMPTRGKPKEPKAPKASKASKDKASRRRQAAREEDEEEDEEKAPARGSGKRMQQPPLLDEENLVPRARQPMRDDDFQVGDQIVWVPQAYDDFVAKYEEVLQKLDVPQPPDVDLMRTPADGTANAAEVLEVSTPETFAPGIDGLGGWLLLRLKQLTMPGADASEADAAPLEYNLPVVGRKACDVDQHAVQLAQYEASKHWKPGAGADSQVSVRFAAPDNADEEEEWEGRVWDAQAVDPNAYPESSFKRLRVIWYVKVKDPAAAGLPETPQNTHWVLDNDQTDTEISPWEAFPSSSHGTWAKKFPQLARHDGPLRIDRSNARRLVPQPESEQVGAAMETQEGDEARALGDKAEEVVRAVMKRLRSNEAAEMLWCPVPETEVDYHNFLKSSDLPAVSLSEIAAATDAGKYAGKSAWRDFASDVAQLVSNAQSFNDDDTVFFHLGSMIEKEMIDANAQIEQRLPELLEEEER